MNNFALVAIVAALLVGGCTNPRSYKVPNDPEVWKTDDGLKKSIEALEESEQQLLARWMVRSALGSAFGAGPTGERTIQEALDVQRTFETEQAAKEAEQKRLAEEVRRQRDAAIAKMNESLTVALTELTFVESNYRQNRFQDAFNVRFALKNESPQDMSGVKGAIQFADIFGDPIKTVNLSVDSPIAAGETIEWSGNLGYNQFRDEDKKLRVTPVEKLKVTWVPEVFLYADGSTAQVPR